MAESTNVIPMPEPERVQLPVSASIDFTPKTLDELIRFSEVLAKSTMVPKDYVDKPGNVLVAIQWGLEIGLKPLQAIQNITVIGQRPGLFGDAGKALLLQKGLTIIEQDARQIESQTYAACTIKRPGHLDVTRTFGIDDAKRARLWGKDGPWTTAPWRQMAWRAFWFAARDIAADILKGMDGAEAIRDLALSQQEKDITPPPEPPPVPEKRSDAALDKVQAKLLKDVCDSFDRAGSMEDLEKAAAKAKKMVLGNGREKAAEHYRAAVARLTPPAVAEQVKQEATAEADAQAEVTPEGVKAAIDAATSKDQADVAIDLSRHFQDEDVLKDLWAHYTAKVATFKGA